MVALSHRVLPNIPIYRDTHIEKSREVAWKLLVLQNYHWSKINAKDTRWIRAFKTSTIWRVTEILCRSGIVLEKEASKEISESLRKG